MRRLLLLGLLCLPVAAQQIIGGGSGGGSGGSVSDITTGLVHHWAMEPGTCSGNAASVADAGSAAENLTCTNTPQWSSTTCAVGSCCIDFTAASSEHCATATSPTIPTGDFTWAFWMRPDANDSTVFVVMDGSGGNELQFLVLTSSSQPQLAFNNTNHNIGTGEGLGAVTLSDWHHVALVRVGSAIITYINGVPGATRLIPEDALDFSTCQILVGVDADAVCDGTLGNYFDGQIDDFRVYSRALSETDLAALYAVGE